MSSGSALYRSLIRAARSLSVRPVGRKIEYNCREVFDIYRFESDPDTIRDLEEDGAAALRLISWLKALPSVSLYAAGYRSQQLRAFLVKCSVDCDGSALSCWRSGFEANRCACLCECTHRTTPHRTAELAGARPDRAKRRTTAAAEGPWSVAQRDHDKLFEHFLHQAKPRQQ